MIKKIKHKIKKTVFNFKINTTDVIIWDYDGTLYQDNIIAKKLKDAYIQYFRTQLNFDFSEEWFDLENTKHGGWAKTIAVHTKQSIMEILDSAEKNFKKHLYLTKNKALVDKINKLNNKKHFILSNSRASDVKNGLKKIGFNDIDSTFSAIIGRDSCQNIKPHLGAFKKIQTLSQLPFHKHLMIGDSVQDDLEPAKKVGFKTMHINELNYFWKIY